jgi:MFS family permease
MNSKKTFHPNKIIRTLITADTLFWAGAFFNSAIAAVYLADVIKIDPVTVIATGYAVYLLARSLPQFQIAKFLDSNKSYADEVYVATLGAVITGLSFYMFNFISEPWHLYAQSIVNGIGVALYLPSWRKLQAKYLDKGQEAKENAVLDSIETVVGAVAALVGAELVALFGSFKPVYYMLGTLTLIGGGVIFTLGKIKAIKKGTAFKEK